jgi:transcriptional regulator with XRE-family HTH domain
MEDLFKKGGVEKEDSPLVKRIRTIIDDLGFSYSIFAKKINVAPAAVSHILISKRNQPSLEVVTKILNAFPEINSDWLLFGVEPMSKNEKVFLQAEQSPRETGNLFDNPNGNPSVLEYSKEKVVDKPKNAPLSTEIQDFKQEKNASKKIDKIMIFYNDNTFMSFSPEQ